MPGGFRELTIETRDLTGLERFWSPGGTELGDRGGRHVPFAMSAGATELEALHDRLVGMGCTPRGPLEHDGGDRSLYVEDPEGNVVEVWSFFVDGDGARDGVAALTDGGGASAA